MPNDGDWHPIVRMSCNIAVTTVCDVPSSHGYVMSECGTRLNCT